MMGKGKTSVEQRPFRAEQRAQDRAGFSLWGACI